MDDGASLSPDPAINLAILRAEHELSPNGIVVIGPDQKAHSYNQRFLKMWGVPREAVCSGSEGILASVLDKVVDPSRFIANIRNVYQHSEDESREEIELKDGRVFECCSGPVMERTAQGRDPGRVWFFRDISDYKLAEQQIREQGAELRAVVEQNVAGVYILALDATINYINPHFAELMGYTQQEMQGRAFTNFIVEDDRERALKEFVGIASGEVGSTQIEAKCLRKDGTIIELLAQSTVARHREQKAIIGVTVDISERNRARKELQRANRALKTISAANAALVRATQESDLLHTMCSVAVEAGGYVMASILYVEHDEAKTLRPVAWAGAGTDYFDGANLTWADTDRGQGPGGIAVRTGEPVINRDWATNPAMVFWRAEAAERGLRSSMAIPLTDESGVFGVLGLYANEPDAFDEDEAELLIELGGDISYGIISLRHRAARAESETRLRVSMEETVASLAGMLEMRDPYTAGHQRRVSKLAAAIAREMGLPEEAIKGLAIAGVVHDIGKIQVPTEILSKPGKLSKAEYQLIRSHAQAGYDIIKGIQFPWPVALMVLQHHERLDGSGYPNALKGDEILIEARILAVADVLESMMFHRPYRAALGMDAALHEIEQGKGRLYDSAGVDACVALLRRGHFEVPASDASGSESQESAGRLKP